MLQPIDLAWLAGIFDGEGSVGLYHRTARGKSAGWAYYVTISNADPSLILRAHALMTEICEGGQHRTRPYVRFDGKRRGNRRLCVSIVCGNKTASEKLLIAIRPYLIAKGPQADALLVAIRAKGSNAHGTDNELLWAISDQLKRMKAPDGDAEVKLQGLRSVAHRNEYGVSPNNNPRMSVRHEAEAS